MFHRRLYTPRSSTGAVPTDHRAPDDPRRVRFVARNRRWTDTDPCPQACAGGAAHCSSRGVTRIEQEFTLAMRGGLKRDQPLGRDVFCVGWRGGAMRQGRRQQSSISFSRHVASLLGPLGVATRLRSRRAGHRQLNAHIFRVAPRVAPCLQACPRGRRDHGLLGRPLPRVAGAASSSGGGARTPSRGRLARATEARAWHLRRCVRACVLEQVSAYRVLEDI